MGTVIIVVWLLAVIAVIAALIRRFDSEARDADTGLRSTTSTFEQPASLDKNAPGRAREGESAK